MMLKLTFAGLLGLAGLSWGFVGMQTDRDADAQAGLLVAAAESPELGSAAQEPSRLTAADENFHLLCKPLGEGGYQLAGSQTTIHIVK